MRALIVLGGDPPGAALLRRCARQADWTAAADSGLAAFHSAGLVPDFLLGDMDSVDPGVLRRYEGRVPEERLSRIKDDTDGVHAVDAAVKRGAKEITLLGALGGRPDHLLGNLMLLIRAHRLGARAEILAEGLRVCRVPGRMTLDGAKGETVSLLALGAAEGVSLRGFFYPLEGGRMDSGFPLGISNTVTADTAEIAVESGDLLLFEFFR